MKYITTIIIVTIFFKFDCIAQPLNYDSKINGNPIEYKETTFEAKKVDGKLVKGKYLNDVIFIKDVNNKYVEQTISPSEKWGIPQNKYDSNNLKTETIEYFENGDISNRIFYKYNIDKQLIEDKLYELDTLKTITTYQYKNSLLSKSIKKNIWSDNSFQITETNFEYDTNKNLVRQVYSDGPQQLQYSYKYDKNNNLIEIYCKDDFIARDKELKLIQVLTYIKFDEYNCTEIFIENSPKEIFCIERVYKYQ